jgi:hypothetical protein
VGCGTLGAAVAYKLCLLGLEKTFPLKSLHLIDNDYFEEKNFPYLTQNLDYELVGIKKSWILKNILSQTNGSLKINPHFLTFPNISDFLKNTFIIDCRDTISSSKLSSVKLNFDGSYGMVEWLPFNKIGIEDSKYRFGNSRFYADVFATIVCYDIYKNIKNNIELKHKQYIYKLNESLEETYELFTDDC